MRWTLAAATAAAGLAVVVPYLHDIHTAADGLPRQINLAHAEGLATEPIELIRSVPDGQNAAPLYRKAIDAFDRRPYSETNRRMESLKTFLNDGKPTEMVKSTLAKWSISVNFAAMASLKPDCDFQRIWQATPQDDSDEMKSFVRLLSARAMLTGNFADLVAAKRVSVHAGTDPTLAGALLQAQCTKIWLDACWRFAAQRRNDSVVVISVRKLVSTAEMPILRNRLSGELVMARARVRKTTLKPDDAGDDLDPAVEAGRGIGGNEVTLNASESRLIELYRRLNAALPDDPFDYGGDIRAFRDVSKSPSTQPSASLNQYLLPPLPQVATECEKVNQRRQAVKTAIDLLLMGGHPRESVPLPYA